MKLLDSEIAPLGMGCWPIGGQMHMDGLSIGYAGGNDADSIRAIHAALDAGIRLFDTAPAYGAGHAERLLGDALRRRDDAVVITKYGYAVDEAQRTLTELGTDPAHVLPAIDASRKRLQRDQIDILLLHINHMPVAEALPLFDEMEAARLAGMIRAYGWSTDYTGNVEALDGRTGAVGIEHAMNVLFDPPRIQTAIAERGLTAFIRSPLAMGLLTGKYVVTDRLPPDDVRASGQSWIAYFRDGAPDPEHLEQIGAVREILQSGGRTLTQGAIGWLWAKGGRVVPLPGARNAAQIEETAGALAHGPLPAHAMAEIDALIDRGAEEGERNR